jgi:hypothetical protein
MLSLSFSRFIYYKLKHSHFRTKMKKLLHRTRLLSGPLNFLASFMSKVSHASSLLITTKSLVITRALRATSTKRNSAMCSGVAK